MTPMGIDINNSKGSVTLTSNFNFNRFAVIVNQVIVIKEIMPSSCANALGQNARIQKPILQGRVHPNVEAKAKPYLDE